MKRFFLSAAIAALSLLSASGQDNAVTVMSYNMLFEHNKPAQPERRWSSRVKYAVRTRLENQLEHPLQTLAGMLSIAYICG